MEQQIDDAIKRGRGYWFVDGFIEMAGGGLLILLGGMVLLCEIAARGSFFSWLISAAGGVAAIKALGILAAVLVVWWLKDRFTYPRTGFVRGKRVPPAVILAFIRNALLFLILPALGLIAAFLFLPPVRASLASMPAWLPAGVGALWAVLCFLLGEWMGLRRFRLLGVLILLVGISIGVWQTLVGFPTISAEALQANLLEPLPQGVQALLDEILSRMLTGVGLLTLLSGILFLFSGSVTFLRYRKENPVPYEEEA